MEENRAEDSARVMINGFILCQRQGAVFPC